MSIDFKPVLDQIAGEKARLTATYEAEIAKLDQTAASLSDMMNGGTAASAPVEAGTASTTRRKPGRPAGSTNKKRGDQPTRAEQTFNLIKDRPGITIPQIAEELSIAPNYLYRVVPKLANDRRIKKEGAGWKANAS